MDNVKLHTEIVGEGRPVVLIHGWPLSGKSWDAQIRPLVDAGYKVITYDRRGFGKSDRPDGEYNYDIFADDLAAVLEDNEVENATLVGFSMGGGEIARYISRHGQDRIQSVVLAGAIPPALVKSDDNPDGPLDSQSARQMQEQFEQGSSEFYEQFTKDFFSANGDGDVLVTEDVRSAALNMAHQASDHAALQSMKAWGEDFRNDLKSVTVPTLVIHGDSDGIVPFEGSGKRTHEAIQGSELHVVVGGPHGFNASHADEFNTVLIGFLSK